MSVNLDLGCGYIKHPDFIALDKLDYRHNIIANVLEGLPFADNHFDFVLMNHTLQMFTYNEHEAVLKEVRRVMKPGGTLRILVPDLERALDAYRTAQWDYFPISDKLEVTFDGKFARYLFWHGETRCAFTFESLISKLQQCDFSDFRSGRFGDCELDSREEESLIMEARK